MNKKQLLLARLIARSHITWDSRSIQELARQFEVPGIVEDNLEFNTVLEQDHPLFCFGCNTEYKKTVLGYPHILTHCPKCEEQKISPLKYKGQFLHAGEAKIRYIEEALVFRNDHTRDYLLSRILTSTIGERNNAAC